MSIKNLEATCRFWELLDEFDRVFETTVKRQKDPLFFLPKRRYRAKLAEEAHEVKEEQGYNPFVN